MLEIGQAGKFTAAGGGPSRGLPAVSTTAVGTETWQAAAGSGPLALLVDLDNWPSFFRELPCALPSPVHVAAYFRPSNAIDEEALLRLPCVREMGERLLLSRSLSVKDSADCKLVMAATLLKRVTLEEHLTIIQFADTPCVVPRLAGS